MRQKLALVALVMLAAACTADSDITPEASIDASGSVVYPCSSLYERCRAAKDAAEQICEWRMMCDPLVTDREACIASAMYTLCNGGAACNVSPYDRTELDACLAGYADATCEDHPTCML